jgi:hypothetical protein
MSRFRQTSSGKGSAKRGKLGAGSLETLSKGGGIQLAANLGPLQGSGVKKCMEHDAIKLDKF